MFCVIVAKQNQASQFSCPYQEHIYAIDSDEDGAIAWNISAAINTGFALSRPTVINTSLMHTL
jgi:hypothetical protein